MNLKFTDKLKKDIVDLVEIGARPKSAAVECGVTTRTWRDWKDKARKGSEEHLEFFERVKASQAKHENTLLNVVDSMAGQSDFKSVTWLLENRYGWSKEEAGKTELVEKFLDLCDDILSAEDAEAIQDAIINGALQDD